ncbi:MAG: AI-2E family transporter [Actinobacteria bacterium]|nr:MAG: AI-2E family transporter [Actinomycetota bacterium]
MSSEEQLAGQPPTAPPGAPGPGRAAAPAPPEAPRREAGGAPGGTTIADGAPAKDLPGPPPPSGAAADQAPAGHDAAAGEPPPARIAPVVIPRGVQLVALLLGALLLYSLAKAAGTVLLIFTVAAVIALILNPLVAFLQRRRLPRGLAVLVVYLSFFVTLGGLGYLLATPVSNQIKAFNRDIPSLTRSANKSLGNAQKFFDRNGIHVQVVKPGKTALQTLQDRLSKESSSIVSTTGDLLKSAVSVGFDLILVFVLSVYMLIYGQRIGALVRSVMPAGDGTPEDDYPLRIQRAVSGYVRGQLLFSLIMGTSAGVCLYLVGLIGLFPAGRTYAVAFGAFYGFMELIPFIGPVLGAVPPITVALFQDPVTALWVLLLFLALQQLEGHVVAPQVLGHALRINPLMVIFALTVGGAIYGLVGALIALPVAAVLRETAIYLRRHVVFESWGAKPPTPPRPPPADAG